MANIPNIRFKGFTDEWEEKKLGSIASKVTEKNIKLEYYETFTNSAEFGIVSQRDYFDHDISNADNINGYYIIRNEDFVYNPRISTFAPVGPINRNKLGRNGVISPLYTVFRVHDYNIDNTYLEQYFKSTHWHVYMYLNGDSGARSDRFSIRDELFFKMPIVVPSLSEQKQIGECLTILDNLITLHQRKCDETKEFKKYMLKKMFPKEGEKIPEIRFKGFTKDWELRKLGELMDVTSTKRIHQSDWTTTGVRFLRARDIVANYKNEEVSEPLYISEEKYEEYSALCGKVKPGDMLVTGVGTIGIPMLIPSESPIYFKDGNIIWFKNENKIDGKFFFYSFISDTVQKFINDSSGIGTVGTYTIDNGKKTPILLPSESEQKKIGTFISNLDSLITYHQRKCDQLKEVKKYMLQNMFPQKG